MELIGVTESDYYPLKRDLMDIQTKYNQEQSNSKTPGKFEKKIDEIVYLCKTN